MNLPVVNVDAPLEGVEDETLVEIGPPGGVVDDNFQLYRTAEQLAEDGNLSRQVLDIEKRLLALDAGQMAANFDNAAGVGLACWLAKDDEFYTLPGITVMTHNDDLAQTDLFEFYAAQLGVRIQQGMTINAVVEKINPLLRELIERRLEFSKHVPLPDSSLVSQRRGLAYDEWLKNVMEQGIIGLQGPKSYAQDIVNASVAALSNAHHVMPNDVSGVFGIRPVKVVRDSLGVAPVDRNSLGYAPVKNEGEPYDDLVAIRISLNEAKIGTQTKPLPEKAEPKAFDTWSRIDRAYKK